MKLYMSLSPVILSQFYQEKWVNKDIRRIVSTVPGHLYSAFVFVEFLIKPCYIFECVISNVYSIHKLPDWVGQSGLRAVNT